MGISSCCLNPLPPTSTLDFTSFPTSPKLVPRKSEEMRSSTRSFRQKCMVGLACSIVIGTEIGDYGVVSKGNYSNASELRRMESSELVAKKNKKMSNRGVKWSDKRSCPSWNINSLETIVPENLPRPYSHRKWDWVLNSSSIFTAPHLFKLPSKLSTTVLQPKAGDAVERAKAVSGEKLLRNIMLDNKIELYATYGKVMNCGGGGSCGTCIVQILDGKELLNERTNTELRYLNKKPESWRLACQTIVGNKENCGKVVVQRIPQWKK